MRTLYIRSFNCPKCGLVCKHKIPSDVRVIDTFTVDGLAEAMYDEVSTIPTLIVDDVRITDLNAILNALGEGE